jgi:hypothetical protein
MSDCVLFLDTKLPTAFCKPCNADSGVGLLTAYLLGINLPPQQFRARDLAIVVGRLGT